MNDTCKICGAGMVNGGCHEKCARCMNIEHAATTEELEEEIQALRKHLFVLAFGVEMDRPSGNIVLRKRIAFAQKRLEELDLNK